MAVHFDYSKESFWKQLLPKDFPGTKGQSVQVNTLSSAPAGELLVYLIFVSCGSPWVLNYSAMFTKDESSAVQLMFVLL